MQPRALLFARLLRAEGLRALGERLRTRRRERRDASANLVPLAAELAVAHVPVLNVLQVSAAPSLGGVQVQLAARLEHEVAQRATALLSPEAGRFVERCRAGA